MFLYESLDRARHFFARWFDVPPSTTGLVPQGPDHRDYVYTPQVGSEAPEVDLRDEIPSVTNQGRHNSCTWHATGALMQHFLHTRAGLEIDDFVFSASYGWYFHREREGNEEHNHGTVLRDAFKVIQERGFVDVKHWSDNNHWRTPPNHSARVAGGIAAKLLLPRVVGEWGYYAVHRNDVALALTQGLPVVFGMAVDTDFNFVRRHNRYIHSHDASRRIGFHAMIIVGYKYLAGDRWYLVRNSYGHSWGDDGHFWLSEDLLRKDWLKGGAFDLWTVA